MKLNLITLFLFFQNVYAFAQVDVIGSFSKAIEDNSYFIEEAYNQQRHNVQHISSGLYKTTDPKLFNYSFTQEWPFFSQKHQLSYTIGFLNLESGKAKGLSDIFVNYRYQLTGHDAFVTMSPRVSLIIPSGDVKKELGDGVWGVQFNLPMSKRLSNNFAIHANIGYTLLPNLEKTSTELTTYKSNNWSSNMGGSLIWLVTSKFNFMFEAVHYIWGSKDINNNMSIENNTILSPGLGYGIDIKNLQIVPGLAVPFTIENGSSDMGLFFYLSFEHPF